MNTSSSHPPPLPDPLAVALAKLEPAPHGFEWNTLMFAAGRESKARALAFWRASAAVCALAAAGLAFAYFARPPAVVERVVVVERAAEKPAGPPVAPMPRPAPEVKPEATPEPRPEVLPTPMSGGAASEWVFDGTPEPGAGARWLTLRNEVLTVGLSVLPDHGRKAQPPREEK